LKEATPLQHHYQKGE